MANLMALNLAGCMKTIASVIETIAKHFEVNTDDVKFRALEENDSYFSVKIPTKTLGLKRYSSEDFEVFCKENHIHGMSMLTPDGCYMVFDISPDICSE